MLSRLLAEGDCDFVPAVWHTPYQEAPRPGPARNIGEPPASTDEGLMLKAEIECRLREAHASGFREGEAVAKRDSESTIREIADRLSVTLTELADTRSKAMRRAEADLVRLSMEIARRVLHRELSIDPAALEALVKAAVAKLAMQEIYRVRIHPAQASVVRACLQHAGRADVEVVDDHSQAHGTVVFETKRGVLDASIESQLTEIERGLTDRLGEPA